MIRRLPLILYAALSQLYLILSVAPIWILWRKTPPDTVFPLYNLHQALPDFYGTLAIMTMGSQGAWLYRNPYTSEVAPPVILYLPYILVGKIAAFFHLWIPSVYLFLQILAEEAVIIGIILLMIQVAGKWRGPWAALAALTLTIPPSQIYPELLAFVTYTPWWVSLDGVERLTQTPHHLLGEGLLLFSLVFFFRWIQNGYSRRAFFTACCLSLFAGFIFPSVLLVPALALPLSVAILWIVRGEKFSRGTFGCILLFILCAWLMMGVMTIQTRSGYYKTIWSQWEIQRWNINEPNFDRDLIISFLPVILLSIPVVFRSLKHARWEGIFFSAWAFMPFLLLPFATTLGIAKVRLLSVMPFVPFAFLITHTIFRLMPTAIAIFCGTALIANTVYMTGRLTRSSLEQSRNFGLYSNIFLPRDTWHVLEYLARSTDTESVILSNDDTGDFIPAFTPLIAYFGHINLTLNRPEKQANVVKFYHMDFSEEEARRFAQENRIRYVYYSPSEQTILGSPPTYSFLKEFIREGNVTVYEIR